MYTNADELVVNGKELEFKDWIGETKPDIAGVVEKKLNKEMKSNQIFPEGYIIVWKEGKVKGEGD